MKDFVTDGSLSKRGARAAATPLRVDYDAYATVVGSLRHLGIPYVPSRGSLFVWVDLSELMAGDSEDAEMQLWQELFRSTGLLLTPGAGFGHGKRGLFRVVYPCVTPSELRVAMDRLAGFVGAKREGRSR